MNIELYSETDLIDVSLNPAADFQEFALLGPTLWFCGNILN